MATTTKIRMRTLHSFRLIQSLCLGLLVLLSCAPADAGQRLKRPADQSTSVDQPTLQMQTPTAEPANPDGSFDLRIRKTVADDGTSVLESGTTAGTTVPNLTVRLEGGVSHEELQKLSKYDVAILLDRSHSMTARDCPPFSYDPVKGRDMGITRWDWCRMQTKPLASLANRASGHTFSITTFYSTFTTFPNVTLNQVERLYAEQTPNLEVGSCLDQALQATLNAYFSRRDSAPRGRPVNPLCIAVITDGRVRTTTIERILLDATKRMRDPDELRITLLMVGERSAVKQSAGMLYLNDTLRRYGARYDIVSSVPFQQLQPIGLSKALVRALPD
jgi:hypothetical protein